jgi:hypothetical protein
MFLGFPVLYVVALLDCACVCGGGDGGGGQIRNWIAAFLSQVLFWLFRKLHKINQYILVPKIQGYVNNTIAKK